MKKILIIDDDRVTARIHRAVLEKDGYQVDVADNGKSGLERLIEFRPDGLLLDLMLPEINGTEVLKGLRGRFLSKSVGRRLYERVRSATDPACPRGRGNHGL